MNLPEWGSFRCGIDSAVLLVCFDSFDYAMQPLEFAPFAIIHEHLMEGRKQ